jgi:hypothetical protein
VIHLLNLPCWAAGPTHLEASLLSPCCSKPLRMYRARRAYLLLSSVPMLDLSCTKQDAVALFSTDHSCPTVVMPTEHSSLNTPRCMCQFLTGSALSTPNFQASKSNTCNLLVLEHPPALRHERLSELYLLHICVLGQTPNTASMSLLQPLQQCNSACLKRNCLLP